MTPRRANLLLAGGLVGLFLAVAYSAPFWLRMMRRPLASEDEPRPEGPGTAPGSEASRRISVQLFFPAPDRPGLVIEEREVAYSDDISAQLRSVAEELARGPSGALLPALPPGSRVLEVFASQRGVAYVDLSRQATHGDFRVPSPQPASSPGSPSPPGPSPAPSASPSPIPGTGAHAELLTVYAVVNTLAVNFPAVKRVQILVEGRPATTLMGHVDLSRPLGPDLSLLAPADLSEAPAGEAGAASPGPGASTVPKPGPSPAPGLAPSSGPSPAPGLGPTPGPGAGA